MSTIQAYNKDSGGTNTITATPTSGDKRALDVVSHGISGYQVDYLEDSEPIYVGKTNSSGTWLIEKLVVSTGVKTYANLSNNSSYATLDGAWSDRATLTYNQFHILTGV